MCIIACIWYWCYCKSLSYLMLASIVFVKDGRVEFVVPYVGEHCICEGWSCGTGPVHVCGSVYSAVVLWHVCDTGFGVLYSLLCYLLI
jgi:hypothetical protein